MSERNVLAHAYFFACNDSDRVTFPAHADSFVPMSNVKAKPDQEHRDRLAEISRMLAKIHKMLLENEIEQIERQQGKTLNPLDRLNMLLNAPELAWLRGMSQLMAFVDEIYFQKEEITQEQMDAASKGVEDLMIKQSNADFAAKYRSMIGFVPDLIVEHGHLKAALKR